MTSRAEESTFAIPVQRSRQDPAKHRRHASRGQRFLFVFALFTFGIAAMYTSIAMLARVTPALFPGTDLTKLSIIRPLAALDTPFVPIEAPDEGSVFNKRINILILGVDRRPEFGPDGQPLPIPDDENAGYLTDTIMVATVDPVSKSSAVLSFPRDMLIEIHTPQLTYKDRINTAYGVGVRNGKTVDAGVEQMKLDMKENFGLEITHYMVLDFKGVEQLVDALGGIEVDIPNDLSVSNWYYSDDDANGRWISFPSGVNRLSGYMAVAFGRHREYDSDFKRVKRQQLVVKTALAKVFTMNLLNDPLGLWDGYKDTVRTDVPTAKMPGYARLLKSTNGQLQTYSVADPVNDVPTLTGYITDGGASVELWDPQNVQYWISQAFTKSTYANASVEIQNGYGEDGSVRTAALGRYLKYSKLLPTVSYGPDQVTQPRTTITLYGGQREMAEDIARWLQIPDAEIVSLPKSDTTLPDVVIVIGKDFRLPGG